MIFRIELSRPSHTATPSSLAPVKSRMIYFFGGQLTQVVLEKGCWTHV